MFLKCLFIGIAVIYAFTTVWSFSFAARTFDEFAKSFFLLSYSPLNLAWYSVFLCQQNKYNALITELNTAVIKRLSKIFFLAKHTIPLALIDWTARGNSKMKMIYEKADAKIEKLIHKTHTPTMLIVTPFFHLAAWQRLWNVFILDFPTNFLNFILQNKSFCSYVNLVLFLGISNILNVFEVVLKWFDHLFVWNTNFH